MVVASCGVLVAIVLISELRWSFWLPLALLACTVSLSQLKWFRAYLHRYAYGWGTAVLMPFLLALLVLWIFSVLAQQDGRRLAERWASDPQQRPAVRVLALNDIGLLPAALSNRCGRDHVESSWKCWEGYRLVLRGSEGYFLMPPDWTLQADSCAATSGSDGDRGCQRSVVYLADEPDMRIEFRGRQ
jgi:hypothetical protein